MPPRSLMIGLVTLAAVRWVVAGATELTAGEALVWLNGKQSMAGFFHYGPLAPWLARAGTALVGDTALGVRLWVPWVMVVASVGAWRLVASAFGEKAAGWFLAAMQLTPLVNLASMRAVPETYAFGCAVLAAWWLWQALHRASRWAWQWPAAGVALGVGSLASPSGMAMVVGLVSVLTIPRRWRGRWRSPGPWVALAIAGAVVWPWISWLRASDWLPVASEWFGWHRNISGRAWVRWVGLMVLCLSPFLAAGVVWATGRAVRAAFLSWRRYRDGGLSGDDPWDQKNGRVFLLGLAAPSGVAAVVAAGLGREALGLSAFPACAGLMLLAAAWVESTLLPATHRLAQNATLLVASVYSLVALNGDLARHLGLRWRYALDPGRAALGHREAAWQTAAALRALRAGSEGGGPAFLIAETPERAALLAFYLPPDLGLPVATATRLRCHVPHHAAVDSDFRFWPGYADEPSWKMADALFVAEPVEPVALGDLRHQFRQVDRFGRVEIRRGQWPVRQISFFACRSWQGPTR